MRPVTSGPSSKRHTTPSLILEGAIVVSADEVDPVLARVVKVTPRPNGTIVHLEILPGDPAEYADALSRAHLLKA
jgi:hypothetical protein